MNPLRSFLPAAAVVGLLAAGGRASAQTQAYAPKTRLIRAAVLTLDADRTTGAYGQTAAPYAFHNLDVADGIKPGGWTFVNPFAPGAVTPDLQNRYADYGATDIPAVGTLIGKRNAAYWTTSLSGLSDTQISSYDVLLVAPRYQLKLNPFEREKLRRFVDGGGVLWVDTANAGPDPLNNLPFAVRLVGGTAGATSDPTSPLLNGPRRVTGADLNLLNASGTSVFDAVVSASGNDLPLVGEFGRYRGAAWLGGKPVIASAHLGDGAIVLTARGAAGYLNQAGNLNFSGNDLALGATGRAAARLAVNIVSMGVDYSQSGSGNHKQGSVAADPGSPVLARFTAEGTYGPNDTIKNGVALNRDGKTPIGAPVTYKGYLVASVYDSTRDKYRVVVFDAVPGRDLDGDGDPDDGIVDSSGVVQDSWRDTSLGRPLDVIWVSREIDNPISAPVCAEAPESGGALDYVLVTESNGQLDGFQLTQKVNQRLVGGDNRAPLFSYKAPNNSGDDIVQDPLNPVVLPPTVYDGLVYVAESVKDPAQPLSPPVGRVWAVQLAGGAGGIPTLLPNWRVGGPGVTGQPLPNPTASPTVGYIPIQDNAGGQDRVMYLPGYTGSATNLQPAFTSLWVGSKGEKPASVESDGTSVKITTRAGARGSLALYNPPSGATAIQQQMGIHVTVTDSNGNPLPVGDYFGTGPTGTDTGVLVYTTTKNQAQFDQVQVRIDYTIDWGHDPINLSGNIARGRLIMPVVKTPAFDSSSRILGPIALTPKGTLHFTQGSKGSSGDTYWAIREDMGQGTFRVVTKYTLNQDYTQTFGALVGTTVPQVLQDSLGDATRGYVLGALQGLGLDTSKFDVFTNFRFAGGVAVRNGVAYVAINALRNAGTVVPLPVAFLAAFKAEPETPEIRLGSLLGTNPRIVQADFARSDPKVTGRTPVSSTLAGDKITVDTENGTLRLESLASTTREEITDSISLSQPVGVSADAKPVTLRVPDAMGDRWSPLLWFALWNGGTAHGAPLVAGSEVFIAADTMLPRFLAPDPSKPNVSGVVWSVDADHPTTSRFAVPNPTRPWLIQAVQLTPVTGTFGDTVSPYFRMPQTRGVTSLAQWGVRLRQTVIGNSSSAYGVAGGGGSVVAYGNAGVYGLSRADFIVCDEGRLLRIDSSGNPVRTAFGGRFSGVGNGGGVAEFRPLVRPVKAYPVGESNTLVVDAGGNRVVLMDEDGTELRALDSFVLDPTYKPDGYRTNDPLTLNDPRDATTYEGYVYKGAQEVVSGQQAVEYWVRYIVADSGNGRVVELADRYQVDATSGAIGDPIVYNGAPQVGVLVWQSPVLDVASRIGTYYNSISRVYIGTLGAGRYVYVAGVSKARPTRASAGLDNPNAGTRPSAGGGAIVVFDPLGGTRVFDRFGMPSLQNTKFLDRSLATYDSVNTPASFDTNTKGSVPPQNNRPFTGLVSVSAQTYFSANVAYLRVMAADADAVYEFTINSAILGDPAADPTKDPADGTGQSSLQPSWMLTEAAYTGLRAASRNGAGVTVDPNAKFFRPQYARRLDSGEVLVVNGYRGITFDNQTYSGEVLLLDGQSYGLALPNLGFAASSVHFELPPLTGIRGLVSPVFADRR